MTHLFTGLVTGQKFEVDPARFVPDFPVASIKRREKDHKIYTTSARETVRESIEHFGVVEPLVVNEDGYLVHGGLRIEVIEALGIETIPVMVVPDMPQDNGLADVYHMLSDRIVEWDKWDSEAALGILSKLAKKKLDSGLTWNDFFKRIGWFIPDTSNKVSATEETIEKLAREEVKWSSTKFHFNWPQLLYIEAFRAEIQKLREAMIARGEIDGGVAEKYRRHMKEEETKIANGASIKTEETVVNELHDELKMNKKPVLGERAKIQKTGASAKVHKYETGGRMMDRGPFLIFAETFGGKSKDEAAELWDTLTVDEFNDYARELINDDLKVDPPKSKVHPLAVGGN